MKPEFKIPLCKALRSGKYPKGTGSLKTTVGYCCLGVGAVIFKTLPGIQVEESGTNIRILDPGFIDHKTGEIAGNNSYWSRSICDLVGISYADMITLGAFNDGAHNFIQVAEYIESDGYKEPEEDFEDFEEMVMDQIFTEK